MPTTTEYNNQYFKLKTVIMLNRRVLVKLCDKHFQFKILVEIFCKTLRFKKINIFSLKYWLLYSVVVGIFALFYLLSNMFDRKFKKFLHLNASFQNYFVEMDDYTYSKLFDQYSLFFFCVKLGTFFLELRPTDFWLFFFIKSHFYGVWK